MEVSTQTRQLSALLEQVDQVVIGKRSAAELILTAMLAEGHVLLEDVPGVGKTQLITALARGCGGILGRLQFTPDIMPTDITGFTLFNPVTGEKTFQPGAAFCNFLLADEINRASPKSQSALLEVMAEGQVSIDGQTHILPKPFLVLATQNPVETYGTFHLPESQMDRFLLKLSMGYPTAADELAILDKDAQNRSAKDVTAVLTPEELQQMIALAQQHPCHTQIRQYIIAIVNATRSGEYFRMGVSPRGSIALFRAVKAYAFLTGKPYVLPDDVKYLAPYVLSHRLLLSPKGQSVYGSPAQAIRALLDEVSVPVTPA